MWFCICFMTLIPGSWGDTSCMQAVSISENCNFRDWCWTKQSIPCHTRDGRVWRSLLWHWWFLIWPLKMDWKIYHYDLQELKLIVTYLHSRSCYVVMSDLHTTQIKCGILTYRKEVLGKQWGKPISILPFSTLSNIIYLL